MKVFLSNQATKHYSKLPKVDQKKLNKKMHALELESLAGKKLKGQLEGLHSLRAWPYRIIYQIDQKSKEVWIVEILHRQSVYK